MAKVRAASSADLDEMIAMGWSLHRESPKYRDMPFSESKLRALAANIDGPMDGAIFLVAEVGGVIAGMMVAVIAERWFCNARFATDLTLYVKPEFRGTSAFVRMVQVFDSWADSQGVPDKVLGVSTEIHPQDTVRIYERLGYTLAGYTMVKSNVP